MALGHKTIETRSWSTSYRGPLAIHASKRLVMPPDPAFRTAIVDLGLMEYEWPLGKIVGVCDLLNCVRSQDFFASLMDVTALERLFGDYSAGRFLWLTNKMEPLAQPVKCRGMQGLFEFESPV